MSFTGDFGPIFQNCYIYKVGPYYSQKWTEKNPINGRKSMGLPGVIWGPERNGEIGPLLITGDDLGPPCITLLTADFGTGMSRWKLGSMVRINGL